jgi:amino acid permease
MSEIRFSLITTVIIVLTYIVAMTVSSLEAVLAYVGSTGSTSISFILPGLFYYKISSPDSALHRKLMKEDDDEQESGDEEDQGLLGSGVLKRGGWRKDILRKLSLGLAVYGVVVMVTCLITHTFYTAAH